MNISIYEKGGTQKNYYREDEVIRRNCPFCDRNDYIGILKERGFLGVVKCRSCNFIYTNPMVKEPEKVYWGDEKKYYEEARLIFENLIESHRDINYREIIRIIRKSKLKGCLLDIGCGMGMFLRLAIKYYYSVGVEPSPALSSIAKEHCGLWVKTDLKDIDEKYKKFDIITMIDVFEHIAKPMKMLYDVKDLLKEDGILVIKVPNGKYSLLKLFLNKNHPDIFDSYEHLTHFTHKTLVKMLNVYGFEVKKIHIGRPVQIPVWHKYVGYYYQYPSPWFLDWKNHILRILFYWISKAERVLRFGSIGYFAPNIIVIACKK